MHHKLLERKEQNKFNVSRKRNHKNQKSMKWGLKENTKMNKELVL
jgi:hypothetical protein